MMLRDWLSINGLYAFDESIFDDFHIPAGMDKDALIAQILIDCAELEMLFPDPDFMKEALRHWSTAKLHIWQKFWDSVNAIYDPISPITKSYTDMENIDDTKHKTTHGSGTASSNTTTEGSSTDENKVSAFNSNSYEPRSKDASEDSHTTSGNTEAEQNGTEDSTLGRGRTLIHTESGNDGVKSPQELLKLQRDIAGFNVYDLIVQDFKKQFCLCVY